MPKNKNRKANGGKKGSSNRNVFGPQIKPELLRARRKASARKSRSQVGEYMRLAGQAIGAASGLPMGGIVGRMAGMGLSQITGHGDYTIKSNSITKDTLSADAVPSFKVTDNETRVRHRELIGNITSGGSGFYNQGWRVNAGNGEVFPWLSNIAKRFQKYKFEGLVFVFKSRCSDYSSAAGMGTVIMASNYNSGDQNYTNVQQMDNSAYAVSCKPSLSLVHPVECAVSDRAREWYFVRDGVNVVAAPQDFDMLIFQLATSGLSAAAGQVIGELWVTYDVVFAESCIPPEAPAEVTPVGSVWAREESSAYNAASTTFRSGGLFSNNNTNGLKLPSSVNLRTGPGYSKALWYYSDVVPTLNTGSSSLMTWPSPTKEKTESTAVSNKVWFSRNGIYRVDVDWAGTSAYINAAQFTITGTGATATEFYGVAGTTGGTHSYLIQVVGVDPLLPNAELPFVNFVGANTNTYQYSTWNFTILA